MKNKDLIALLSELPQNLDVYLYDDDRDEHINVSGCAVKDIKVDEYDPKKPLTTVVLIEREY